MITFFLSYSRADQATALRFADALIAAGVPLWVDQYEIQPSQHWDLAVESAVRRCGGLIVMLSPRSAASPNVADEISVAIDEKKAIIPILIETCLIPLRLSRVQYIDAMTDMDRALKQCIAAIADQRDAPPVRPHIDRHLAKPLPDPAPAEPSAASGSDPAQAAPVSLTDRDVKLLSSALARHIGPIADLLVTRERAQGGGVSDLRDRLATRIGSPTERAAFLKETASLCPG
jgi:hypothetical protein